MDNLNPADLERIARIDAALERLLAAMAELVVCLQALKGA